MCSCLTDKTRPTRTGIVGHVDMAACLQALWRGYAACRLETAAHSCTFVCACSWVTACARLLHQLKAISITVLRTTMGGVWGVTCCVSARRMGGVWGQPKGWWHEGLSFTVHAVVWGLFRAVSRGTAGARPSHTRAKLGVPYIACGGGGGSASRFFACSLPPRGGVAPCLLCSLPATCSTLCPRPRKRCAGGVVVLTPDPAESVYMCVMRTVQACSVPPCVPCPVCASAFIINTLGGLHAALLKHCHIAPECLTPVERVVLRLTAYLAHLVATAS